MSIRSAVLSSLILIATLLSGTVAYSPLANAQTQSAARKAVIGEDFRPTHEQIESLKRGFTHLSEDKTFFHWTTPETGMRWMIQGHLDQGEVDFYNTPTDSLQAYGAGIYMASNPTSSEGFGEFCVVFKMRAGTLLYSPEVAKQVFGRELTNDEMTELGKKIPFVRDLNGDWHITHAASNLSQIEYAGPYGGDARMFKGTDQRTMLKAIETAKTYGDVGYLESFFHLMHYMDGISLQRAIRVAPSNPWSQFEPHLFENFRKLNQSALEVAAVSPEVAMWGPNETDKEAWATKQVRVKLPGLINSLNNSSGAAFRGHPIRAGGSSAGETFLVSPQELNVLLANPYLTVESKPDGTGFGFLVSYSYPDIRNLKKLKPLLSADVYEQLEKHNAQSLASDRGLEVRLNQILIEDLLRNLMRDLHGKAIDPADFINRYISIHPFSDGNGRSGRLFLQEHMNLAGQSLPPFYISDLDLLVSKETLAKVIADSDKAYLSLQKAMLGELIASNFGKKRLPDYFKLKQFQELITSLAAFGFKNTDRIDPRFDDYILKRRFHEMFAEMKGPAWSLTADPNLPAALEFARKSKATNYLKYVGEKTALLIANLKNSSDLESANAYLKNMMLYATPLKEYPSLKKAYALKIKKIVRKLDFNQESHFEILDQYIEMASPQEARETLAFVTRGLVMRTADPNIPWEVRSKQDELRTRVQTSEMKQLIAAMTQNQMSPNEFSGRIARLDLKTLDLGDLDLDFDKLKVLNEKLTWKQQTVFLQRLNFSNFEVNDDLAQFMSKLVEPLRDLKPEEAPEYRKYLGAQIASLIQGSDWKKPTGRLFFELWLQTVSDNRYKLASIMEGNNKLVLDRMIEIAEEDLLSGKTLTKEENDGISFYIYFANQANRRIRVDYKSWMKFFKGNPNADNFLASSLRAFHFKTPLYYALLATFKGNDDVKQNVITSIASNSSAVAGGEQLRLELLKEAKRSLTPNSYRAVAENLVGESHIKDYNKLAKKAGGIILKLVFAELSKSKPDFSAVLPALASSPKVWANFNDAQIRILLSDAAVLEQVVNSNWTLKLSLQQYGFVTEALAKVSDSVKKAELQKALQSSFMSAWTEASYYKATSETIRWQFSEYLKLGKLTLDSAIQIEAMIGKHLDQQQTSVIRSLIRKEFFQQVKLMASGKMDAAAQSAFVEKAWAPTMVTLKLSAAEQELITRALRTSKNSDLFLAIDAVEKNRPFVSSDYYQALLSAIGSFAPDTQTTMVNSIVNSLVGRSVVDTNEDGEGSSTKIDHVAEAKRMEIAKEDLKYFWKSLPYSLEITAKAAVDSVVGNYITYDGAYKRAALTVEAFVKTAEFKRDVYKLRYGRAYSGPKTCQAVFSPLMN